MKNANEKVVCACPLNGKACVDGSREDFQDQPAPATGKLKCRWWQHLYGKDPQGDGMIDQWDCAVAWLPILQTEGAQMTRHATAGIDKLANQMNVIKDGLSGLGHAIDNAGAGIQKAIESGALQVMLPTPGIDGPSNGHDTRELSG